MVFQLGGKKIVENVGNNTRNFDSVKGIFSDIGTILNLFIASLFGLPVSTSHVKTISIVALENNKANNGIKDIFKAWIWTFPVCFIISYFLAKFLIQFL